MMATYNCVAMSRTLLDSSAELDADGTQLKKEGNAPAIGAASC
jgi:hypothetical protein